MQFITDFISCIAIILQTYLQFDIGNGVNILYISVACLIIGIIVTALVRNVVAGFDAHMGEDRIDPSTRDVIRPNTRARGGMIHRGTGSYPDSDEKWLM